MKIRILAFSIILLGSIGELMKNALAQGTFQNLGFEAVRNIPQDPPGHMPAADALPGWRCYVGSEQVQSVLYNGVTLDGGAVGIISSTSAFIPQGFSIGDYSLSLQAGTGLGGAYTFASVAQTGQIPSDTKSLRFRGYEQVTGGIGFSVTFGGNQIPLQSLSMHDSYNEYGADISQFAGETGELRITSISHFSYLDRLVFSPLAEGRKGSC